MCRPEPQGRRVCRREPAGSQGRTSDPEMREDMDPTSAWPAWGEATLDFSVPPPDAPRVLGRRVQGQPSSSSAPRSLPPSL